MMYHRYVDMIMTNSKLDGVANVGFTSSFISQLHFIDFTLVRLGFYKSAAFRNLRP